MSRIIIDVVIPILDALLISQIFLNASEIGRVKEREIKTYLELEDEDQL